MDGLMKVYCAEPGRIIKEVIMKVYCADSQGIMNNPQILKKLPSFNILTSFYYIKHLSIYLPFANNMLIDSGAFTLQQKKKANYTKYFKEYCKFVEAHHNNPKIQGFFDLDIHEKVGYNQVLEYRKELFEITSKIIPVWHKPLGLNEYKKMCDNYNYIGVSCVKDRSIPSNKYGSFVGYAHQHQTKFHGLGMLRPKILDKVPFDSVDGTGWFKAARFGKRKNRKINTNYIKQNRVNLVFLELLDHIRFQRKYEEKWKNYTNKQNFKYGGNPNAKTIKNRIIQYISKYILYLFNHKQHISIQNIHNI